MNRAPLVIKIGGAAIDRARDMMGLWQGLVALHEREVALGSGVVIVHGGGAAVDRLLGALGLGVVRVNGIRVTPDDQIDHVVSILAGLVNRQLVGALRASGGNAVGLSLADGLTEARLLSPEFGRVGEITGGDPSLIHALWRERFLPVVSSIGADADGHALNVNADAAAGGVARTLGARALVFLTDVPGVLDSAGAIIGSLRFDEADALIGSGAISGGMVAKVRAAMGAVEISGVGAVIASWNAPNVLTALGEGGFPGTTIVAEDSPSLITPR